MAQFGRTTVNFNNPGSASTPGINDDVTAGFAIGSSWYDTRTNIVWNCVNATAGAARWAPVAAGQILASLIGANMNVATDQPMSPHFDLTTIKFSVAKILVTNASLSLTTAAGGIYDTAAKGGNAIVAAGQVYSALTAATKLLSLTIASAGSSNVFSVVPILSLTTGQGAAATADFYLIGDIIPLA